MKDVFVRRFKNHIDFCTTIKNRRFVSLNKIKEAEQVLIDNGIEKDEAATVLQAIGYVLLDTELYPEENNPEN